ncbi:hypothetical protein JTE90_021371 [Oedothorax gibbosus]|uniref:Uncharacterized protein n=1 Tax=Oedothorax gibbosus TaxID=931172 RepID=A0AAV6VEA5_9ARAC|nr:hypothetical protein JTE90_021371 [Oedothorax gibbosus]
MKPYNDPDSQLDIRDSVDKVMVTPKSSKDQQQIQRKKPKKSDDTARVYTGPITMSRSKALQRVAVLQEEGDCYPKIPTNHTTSPKQKCHRHCCDHQQMDDSPPSAATTPGGRFQQRSRAADKERNPVYSPRF